jgi:D-3-phosphoglycerate dehydrogenase/(S)-sulfolactate dehydrogenase
VTGKILLVSHGSLHARERLAPLAEAGFELVERWDLDQTRDGDALVAALDGVWATVAGSEHYTRTVLDRAPSLRAIARCGVGYDAVDVAAATDHGIAVLTTPGANADAVADLALMLMLACRRRLLVVDRTARTGGWRPPELARDLASATVGIVGLGAIGRAVARRLHGFDCRILAVEPFPDLEFCTRYDIELRPLDELLPEVDVLTLHAPLSEDTRHLIGERELALMKPSAVLVNTSRGAAVDEAALVAALASGRLAGAGLDVFEQEPLTTSNPLTAMEQVVLSGHAATFTELGVAKMIDAVVENLLSLAEGRLPRGCVNPAVAAPTPLSPLA